MPRNLSIVKREMTTEWLDRETEGLLVYVSQWLLNVHKTTYYLHVLDTTYI